MCSGQPFPETIADRDTNLERGTSPVNLSQPFSTTEPFPTEAMPAGVANAVNRDYRDLMKAIEKKKGR